MTTFRYDAIFLPLANARDIAIFAWNVWRGLRTGFAGFDVGGVWKRHNPGWFRFSMIISVIGCVFMLITAIVSFGAKP